MKNYEYEEFEGIEFKLTSEAILLTIERFVCSLCLN